MFLRQKGKIRLLSLCEEEMKSRQKDYLFVALIGLAIIAVLLMALAIYGAITGSFS